MNRIKTFYISLTSLLGVQCAAAQAVDQSVVQNFDLEKYLGKWYEIARYDHSFERGLSHVTANYSLRDDGKVRVENRGIKRVGTTSNAIGKAKLVDEDMPSSEGKLEVSFFLNFYAPYNILMLDDNYTYVLVSSGTDYLWILSRTPTLPPQTVQKIVDEAVRRGFDSSDLIWVDQS